MDAQPHRTHIPATAAQLRKVFDYSNDAGFVISPQENRIVDANIRACELLGYTRDELLSLSISDVHPDEMPRFNAFARGVMESGYGWTDELTCLTKTGEKVTSEISAATVEVDEGVWIVAWIRDIRDRKAAEDALRTSEARFRLLVENAAEAFYVFDRDSGLILDVNQQATLDTGYTRDELVGRLIFEISDSLSPEGLEVVGRQIEETGPVTTSGFHRRKDGSLFTVEVRACLIEYDGRPCLLGLARDVTEKIDLFRKEQELERARLEVGYLREELEVEHNYHEIVGASPPMQRLFREMQQVAQTDSTVLITGETGTGKELVARAIHADSPRGDQVLVKVNCAALSAGLIESELFGHEQGAFTGALAKRVGRFELADGGTIFLDEVGDLPAELQAKLLRVLQECEFERVGGTATLSTDVRVIAATNQDLNRAVEEECFRTDLYYRLSVFPLSVPSLRDRTDDIPLLVHYFVEEFSHRLNKEVLTVSDSTMRSLVQHPWHGNVRELRNVIERGVILSPGPDLVLSRWQADRTAQVVPDDRRTLEDVERGHITSVLEGTRWRVGGSGGAAEILAMKPTTLRSRMKKLGVEKPAS